ncbi:MAG: endo-1,3-alpha-glucanase family glycosylhydrolase [Capsulimonadaceae bacterium]|nr:endo-1,3-alpha-glucanase family glycosylhydrolase [Capsulimonadaceae bacterium]
MKHCVLELFALACLSLCTLSPAGASEAGKHAVFAHYMVCFATYGESIDGYKRDILEAQAAGIDGFALNEGAWTNEPHYFTRTRMLFDAAHELNTGFKFIFSLDLATLKPVYIPEILRAYVNDPAYYRYQGRPVVSTFGGDRGVDWPPILDPLKADGYKLCFVPFFYPDPVTELPSYEAVKAHFARWSNIADGYFFFGAAGSDSELTACNASYVKAAREAHKLVMASYTPFYWGAGQPGRRYYETHGGFGVERQWMSIIATQPDFVEIVTWNDFNETYITPVDDPGKYEGGLRFPVRHPHAGYLELSRYFIEWYKTGHKPKIKRDRLVYVYRVHPKNAIATLEYPGGHAPSARMSAPVTDQRAGVQDEITVTTLLTAPAEIRVVSGGVETRSPMPAGYSSLAIPFHVGEQHFALYRNGKLVTETDGEPVTDQPFEYNFFPTTGIAFGK